MTTKVPLNRRKGPKKTVAGKKKGAQVMAKPKPGGRRPRKRERKNVTHAVAHIRCSFNNTIVSFADMEGNVLAWASSGNVGFKGSRKSTPYAAQMAAEQAARQAMEHGVRKVDVQTKGPGSGRETAIRSIQNTGIEVTGVKDVTPAKATATTPASQVKLATAGLDEALHGLWEELGFRVEPLPENMIVPPIEWQEPVDVPSLFAPGFVMYSVGDADDVPGDGSDRWEQDGAVWTWRRSIEGGGSPGGSDVIETAVGAFRARLMAHAEVISQLDLDETRKAGTCAADHMVSGARWATVVGDRLDTTQVTELLGVTRQALSKRQRSGSILGLHGQATTWYPIWQFDLDARQVRPGIRYIVGAFRDRLEEDYNPMTVASWASSEQTEDLGGLSPAQWLAEGRDPDRLFAAADRAAARLSQ